MQNEQKVESLNTKGFTGNQLKLFAIIAMTIDHLTCVIWPGYNYDWWIILLHIIGRLTAPTMWFMCAEGYAHTHNVKKYIARLFVFAFISHFAYNFAFGIPFIPFKTTVFNQTSVIWALAWGIVLLCIIDAQFLKQWQKTLFVFVITAIVFPADWSSIAVLAIMEIHIHRGSLTKQILHMEKWVLLYALVWFFCIDKVYAFIQLGVIIVWPFVKNYNGQRGGMKFMKWFFYIYYPAHLVLCGLIRLYLHGNISAIVGG
ncbi:MAG: conjugal transfer protein TraX [Treponema sp.]|nr:conjugal transfer protein TraX [Treponema sp.]MBQ5449878.1 conjugal transfer protein TraX [Treponema sp.]